MRFERVLAIALFVCAGSAFAGMTPTADVSVTKSGSPNPVTAGSNVVFTITLTNAGPDAANSVSLTDNLPAGTTFVSFAQTTGPAFTTSGGPPSTATILSLPAAATATFDLTVHIPSAMRGGSISNTVSVTHTTFDPNPVNNSFTSGVEVGVLDDLSVVKSDSPDPVTAGSNITYTMTFTNAGPSDADLPVLTDNVPANTTFVSMAQNSGPAFTLTTPGVGGIGAVTANAATLAAGATATFTMVVKVNASTSNGTIITNTATASGMSPDGNSGNDNSITTTTVAASADLVLTKTDSPDPVNQGANITYTLTLTNNGPSDAQLVSLNDAVPAGTTLVSFVQNTGPAFIIFPATTNATAFTLAAGASATFTLVVNVGAATTGTISNTANVSSTTADPNGANNTATANTVVNTADLAVAKSDTPDPVAAGSNISYTLTIVNNGPASASNVTLSDSVPANTTFVSMVQTSGPAFTLTTGPATESATIATFAPGASATFTLVVNVNAGASGTITNTATATSASTDPIPGNNSATATTTITPSTADLAISKTSGSGVVTPGTNVTYTITVTNGGPATATGVSVVDTLPAGVTFVSATPSQGTCSGTGPVTCSLGSLTNGATATISLVVQSAATGGSITNTATVSSTTTDPNPANNTAVSVFSAAIPTLSEWMLLLLALTLAAVGFVMKD